MSTPPVEAIIIRKLLMVLLILIGSALLVSCNAQPNTPTPQANMPNTASVHCEERGGKLDLRQDESGRVADSYIFPSGSECDQWAYFRRDCKPGDSLVNPALSEIRPTTIPAARTISYSNWRSAMWQPRARTGGAGNRTATGVIISSTLVPISRRRPRS